MSAAACPFCAEAAVDAAVHALTVSAAALHLVSSCWQTKSEMTLMASADPWLKLVWSTAAKACSLGRSFCVPKVMAGSLHEPKSSAARRLLPSLVRSFLVEAAALHSLSVVGGGAWLVYCRLNLYGGAGLENGVG